MDKLPSNSLEAINSIVDSMFDRMAYRLLGNIPALADKKIAIFSTDLYSNLPNLFVQSIGMRSPNKPEGEILKNLLSTAHSYIEALKHRTKAKLAEELGSNHMTREEANERIGEILEGAGKHFQTIAETEATKTRNLGKASKISKVASDMGVSDPLVYFVLVRDAKTCHFCIENHTINGTTPKVFKLSQVKVTYLTKDEKKAGRVSVSGQHPNCRCTMSFLAPGYGFGSDGLVKYIRPGHDELAAQNPAP